jgi:hypothetical protein
MVLLEPSITAISAYLALGDIYGSSNAVLQLSTANAKYTKDRHTGLWQQKRGMTRLSGKPVTLPSLYMG